MREIKALNIKQDKKFVIKLQGKTYKTDLAQINAYLVSWKEKYIGIIIKSVICPISMVNIKINDKHTLQPMYTLGITSCNGHISKNTEPHRPLWNSMMSWRSYQSKAHRWIQEIFWCCNLKYKIENVG